jgi:hypothetical protein
LCPLLDELEKLKAEGLIGGVVDISFSHQLIQHIQDRVLTQNLHLAPSTQQAEQSWLNTRAGSEACQSIFLKLTKDEKQLDKTWNLPGGTRQFRIYG